MTRRANKAHPTPIQRAREQSKNPAGPPVSPKFRRPAAGGNLPRRVVLPVGEDWLKMIGRARSGGYAGDRAVTLSEEELSRIRQAPVQCSKCGAAVTAPVLRGQMEIQCEYCGLVTHL